MELTPYLFFTGFSLICNVVFSVWFGFRDKKIARKHIGGCAIVETISIVLGAKLLDVVFHWDFYEECMQNLEWLRMLTVGYTFLGGVIGAILSVLIYASISKEDVLTLASLFLPNLLLVYGVAKIGCYCNGCCKGIGELPIQLIESTGYLSLWIFLRFRKIPDCTRLSWTGILFGFFRFFIEFLRENTGYMPVSISQVFAICIGIAGVWSIYYPKKLT